MQYNPCYKIYSKFRMSKKNNTVTKEHLARAIKQSSGLPIAHAQTLVADIFNLIRENLQKGNPVKLRMFGTFSTKRKNKRVGRNPKNMVEAEIPARTVVKFKVAPTLKKKINDNIECVKG